jgi:hypothetical protein
MPMKEIVAQLHAIWRKMKPLQKVAALAVALFIAAMLGSLIMKSGAKESEKASFLEEDQPPDSNSTNKGFELFDTNTWIKGEKA